MTVLALLLVLVGAEPLLVGATPLPGPVQEADALRSEVGRLRSEVTLLQAALRERDALLVTVREELAGVRGDLRELRDRPQVVAAPFLAAPAAASDRLGVAKTAVLAPRVEVESFLRHDTVVLKLRRVEAGAVRTVGEVEITPDASGVDLPLDQSGALYLVEWSTSEGHVYNLVLRDGASGQPAASVPVKERQSEGRFALVGYRVD
jgi:hypothetical protein